jgi:hypothetical protein
MRAAGAEFAPGGFPTQIAAQLWLREDSDPAGQQNESLGDSLKSSGPATSPKVVQRKHIAATGICPEAEDSHCECE